MVGYAWMGVVVVIALAAVMLVRAFRFARPLPPVEPVARIKVDVDATADRLAQVVACQTVSYGEGRPVEGEAFAGLHQKLAELYPLVHARLERRVIAGYSLLYTWPGTDAVLEPILLMAHQDVVPADPATLAEWTHAPFTTGVVEGRVWGRGALDCKGPLVGELEAVEYLLRHGFQPLRTVYLAFGHDEEVGGTGARATAVWLQDHGVELKAVLDEGGVIAEAVLPGVDGPAALVGNVEKGYLTLELSVTQPPGHSAAPPKHTAIGILARAITRIEARPLPSRLDMVVSMFRGLGTALPFSLRLVMANTWLFGGALKRVLSASMMTNAMTRTTAAATVVSGGVKDNILPGEARALVNFRLLPGDTRADVLDRVGRIIDDDRVVVQAGASSFKNEPSPVSPTDTAAFGQLSTTIRQIFGAIPVAPYLVFGGTDARSYHLVCKNIYRFSPVRMDKQDLERIHGIDECIAVDDLDKMVRFFVQLIRAWSAG